MGNHTIRRAAVPSPRRRELRPTARLTKDAIDRLNAQRIDPDLEERQPDKLPLGTATLRRLGSEREPSIVHADSEALELESFDDELDLPIEVTAVQSSAGSRQDSTIPGMPPLDRAPAAVAKPTHRDDSRALEIALVLLTIGSLLFAILATAL